MPLHYQNSQDNDFNSYPVVSMKEALRLFFVRWNDFGGCSSRTEYWKVVLWQIAYLVILGILVGFGSLNFDTAIWVYVVSEVILMIPSLALFIRRMRDAGFSLLTTIIILIIAFCPSIAWIKYIFLAMPSKKSVKF